MAGQEWTVPPVDAGIRLDKFLAHPERLVSRARAFTAIDRGKVFVNDTPTTAPATRLTPDDVGRVGVDKPGRARRPIRPGLRGDLDIVYEDEVLIVINKP